MLATVVLSTVLVPIAVSAPAQAQSQTDWYFNDEVLQDWKQVMIKSF